MRQPGSTKASPDLVAWSPPPPSPTRRATSSRPRRNSLFTNLLVDKGLLRGQGDVNGDGRVSIQEAFKLAAERAPALTAGEANGLQHPYMAGGDGTEWFLDKRAAATAAAPRPPRNCILFFCF